MPSITIRSLASKSCSHHTSPVSPAGLFLSQVKATHVFKPIDPVRQSVVGRLSVDRQIAAAGC